MAAQEVPMHTIDRTPEYEDFMTRLRDYHTHRGTVLDPEPKVGTTQIDLLKVFNHIVASGGYDKVSEEKLAWRRMASELGLYSNNEASTAFSLKEKFYKNLAAFEISTVHGKEPPPKDILEDVTAKGANLLTRTRDNYRGKRESNIGANDSAASGDDGTPTRERSVVDPNASGRASRGLREAPTQRVIFQPDTGSSRNTRQASVGHHPGHAGSPAMNPAQPGHYPHGMPPMHHGQMQPVRGPSIMHNPENMENSSPMVAAYQPKALKPFPLRPVATPSNAPNEFIRKTVAQRPVPMAQEPILPGTGFEGPNIYMRCLNALRSGVTSEQMYALNHLVKISFERGDKFRFDSFPGLAEGLVDKALDIGALFYHVSWKVSWDTFPDPSDVGALNGNEGTRDILERIDTLIERDVPDVLQTEAYTDEMVLVTEAVLTVRNMVTLPENAHNMSDFPPLKDLICIILHLPARDSLIELKHLALDIAEQLTPFLVLDSEDPLYKTLLAQMTSNDRGTIVTALRALGRISVNLDSTNNLGDIPPALLQKVASWLLLNDDVLMDACLDFLYQYTAVVPNVDNLIRSIVPDNLVEQLVRLLRHGANRVQRDYVMVAEQRKPSHDEIASMPKDLLRDMLTLEEPERVHKWVECFFEEDQNSFVTQLAAWQSYQAAFVGPLKEIGQTLITPADFIRNSTSVYKNSNAQVLREPGDPQQKFIINGLRARARPLGLDGKKYGRCVWSRNPARRGEKCGSFYPNAQSMWTHILSEHLGVTRNAEGQFDNIEVEFRCTWGECLRYDKPTKMHLQDFARHIMTHISTILPNSEAMTEAQQENDKRKAWVVPGKTLGVMQEETLTVLDDRNPNAPPQAVGIPLSAVLVLRNIARNIVKTETQEELLKQQKASGAERGGWNEKLFRPVLPRLFEILTENKALAPYVASLLDLIRVKVDNDEDE